MAKKELMWAPLLGGYLVASGAVFVDRRNNSTAVESLKAAGDFMKKNKTSLWLFPEGTRSMRKHHDLLPFKKGAFHTAVQAGIPITPVVCENYWRLYHKGHLEGGELKIRGEFKTSLTLIMSSSPSFVCCSTFSPTTD
jgi:lysophosphatidate acyltransferase